MCDYVRARHHRSPSRSEVEVLARPLVVHDRQRDRFMRWPSTALQEQKIQFQANSSYLPSEFDRDPSVRQKRASSSNGSPLATDTPLLSTRRSTSSGWTADRQPEAAVPSAGSKLRGSTRPSLIAAQAKCLAVFGCGRPAVH